jgi:type IV pilus assembly protein PilA
MLKRLRERAGSESGFTLIELLVVMLILGILAAIAIPAFLNQKGKANDSAMKVQARTMQTAMETWSTDHNGSYLPAPTAADLHTIEPTIPANVPNPTNVTQNGYTVTSRNATGTNNNFSITRVGVGAQAGTVTHNCVTQNTGGCPTGGNW